MLAACAAASACMVSLALAHTAALESGAPGERSWRFRVLLDGREIGTHEFHVRDSAGGREVASRAHFEVKLLGVTVYRYNHEADEHWQGDCLRELHARTRTNGSIEAVEASADGERLRVEHDGRRDLHPGCIMPFAYWNPRILAARELLNVQTGELLPVGVTRLGTEAVPGGGTSAGADRYRLTTPKFHIDVWYAGDRWVGLEAPTGSGRILRYELVRETPS